MDTHTQSSENLFPSQCVCVCVWGGGGGVVMHEAQVLMVEDSPHRTVQPAHNAILMRPWVFLLSNVIKRFGGLLFILRSVSTRLRWRSCHI